MPKVRHNYLKEAADKRRIRECVELVLSYLQTAGNRKVGAVVVETWRASLAARAELDHWIATNLLTAYRSAGTCRMRVPDKGQIEDSDIEVPGLRIRIGTTGTKTFML